jgi:hypothetical protein
LPVAAADRPDGPPDLPLVWRIPPWQPACLILLATVLLGLDLYGDLSLGPLVMTGAIALAALVGAVFAGRLLLIADEDGIWVRRLFRERVVPWRDVDSVQATLVTRNTMTIRIFRKQGGYVDVPPSLLLPTLPTKVRNAQSRVHKVALQLSRLAVEHRSA